jgi:hypothetical protein
MEYADTPELILTGKYCQAPESTKNAVTPAPSIDKK